MGTVAYPGKRFPESSGDRYERILKLGEGGMGVVWEGRDLTMGRKVAIKVMKDVSDSSSLELFEKEWKALAALSHPNIVDVGDAGILYEDGQEKPFFVMPLLQGKTLAQLIRESSERLRVSRVGKIITDVCAGLQAAHQHGLIHRDLKPSNIFVLDDDTVKIIDFGVVHLTGAHSAAGQKGTLQYMSPEQIEGKDISPASDVFSLGVVLYEALTGRNPFVRHTRDETRDAVQRSNPQPVSKLNPGIPHPVAQVVHKCLAKKPANRFSSARELSELLNKALQNQPVFDIARLRDRLERIKAAIETNLTYAAESLAALESEGHLAPEITGLRNQIDAAVRQRHIDELLEFARTSMQHDDEVEAALAKLRDVLEIDPDNPEARSLKAKAEKKRSEKDAAVWIDIGNSHLTNRDFSEARKAVNDALHHHPGDSRALELLRKIGEVESVAIRVREQKEQFYDRAMRDFHAGDIESARSRLDRLFSEIRLHPEGAVPERDAVFESFYNEVCSASDSLRSRYEEAQRTLEAENFAQARSICSEQLLKYPKNEDLKLLKLQIDFAERQKISADFAAATKNADTELDLNRRANIWQEAVKAHPEEPRFAELYKLTCERRDFVNSIIEKAEQFGKSEQYSDALNQWERLRKLHPGYPGLSFELEQARKKRDQQIKLEEKARVAEEIFNLMKLRDLPRALQRINAALLAFPSDDELMALLKMTEETWGRVQESGRLCAEGQDAEAANDPVLAIELLKKALTFDNQNSVAQDVLIRVYTDQARIRLDSDLNSAEQYHKDASAIDPNHQLVRSLGVDIGEAHRQKFVSECLIEARGLDALGNATAALDKIREARRTYSKDVRLQQFRDFLLRTKPELQLHEEVLDRRDQLKAAQVRLEREPDLKRAKEVQKLARDLSARDPNDAVSLKAIADADASLKQLLSPDDFKTLISSDSDFQVTNDGNGSGKLGLDPKPEDAATVLDPRRPDEPAPPVIAKWWAQVQVRSVQAWRNSSAAVRAIDLKTWRIVFASAGGAVIAVAAVAVTLYWASHLKHQIIPPPPLDTKVHLDLNPADSNITVDGQPHGSDFSLPPGKTQIIEVSRLGYQKKTLRIGETAGNQSVIIEPLPVHLSIATSLDGGYLELDGQDAGELTDVAVDGVEVPSDRNKHRIAVVVGAQRFMELEFQASPGQQPTLTQIENPASIKDVLIVASLGPNASIYAGDQVKNPEIGGQAVTLGTSAYEITQISDHNNVLTYKYRGQSGALPLTITDWPTLLVRSLSAAAAIVITCNVETATLTANGIPVPKRDRAWRITQPGIYNFVLSAANYKTKTWRAVLKPMQQAPLDYEVMYPTVSAPVLGDLTISKAPPGAHVDVDGTPRGEVGPDGSVSFTGILLEGSHRVQFTGPCGSRTVQVDAVPPKEASISGVTIDPCAGITLQATSIPVTVKIRRSGEEGASRSNLTVGQRKELPAGNYEIVIEAPQGFKPYQTGIRLDAGHNLDFTPLIIPVQDCQLQTPGDVTEDGEWKKAKNSSAFVFLRAGCLNVNLPFRKSGVNSMGKERVELQILANGGTARIDWSLDGGTIHRKVTVGPHSLDKRDVRVQDLLNGSLERYDIRVRVEEQHIKVLTGSNAVLDDYVVQNPALHDIGAASLGVRTSAEFQFSGSEQ
jgi:serine/threonine protein kinase